MLKIGLTGCMGSGKTWVSKVFSTLDVAVYQADIHAHDMLNRPEVQQKLGALFGKDIMDIAGNIDRRLLADRVFSKPRALELLNNLVHPLVMADFECWSQLFHAKPYVIMEAAILLERGYQARFDAIVLVTAPLQLRMKRVMDRDHLTNDQYFARAARQWTEEEKLEHADFVIDNEGVLPLLPQVLSIHQSILHLQ